MLLALSQNLGVGVGRSSQCQTLERVGACRNSSPTCDSNVCVRNVPLVGGAPDRPGSACLQPYEGSGTGTSPTPPKPSRRGSPCRARSQSTGPCVRLVIRAM